MRSSARWGLAVVVTGAVVGTALAGPAALSVGDAPSRPPVEPAPAARSAPSLLPSLLPRPAGTTTTDPPFDRGRRSTRDPRSIRVVVNKARPIDPLDFRPELELVRGYLVARSAAGPLAAMLGAADARRLGLKIASAYRSNGCRRGVYDAAVALRGPRAADQVSARPGHSEHQTGLAVDLVVPGGACSFAVCLGETRAGRWLARHAWRFGYLVRYQAGTSAITG